GPGLVPGQAHVLEHDADALGFHRADVADRRGGGQRRDVRQHFRGGGGRKQILIGGGERSQGSEEFRRQQQHHQRRARVGQSAGAPFVAITQRQQNQRQRGG